MDDQGDRNGSSDINTELRCRYFRQTQDRYDLLSNDVFIGEEFLGLTFKHLKETAENKTVLEAFSLYAKDLEENIHYGESIGLMGATGTGKTAIMVAFYYLLLKNSFPCLLISMIEFFERLKRTFGTEEGKQVMTACKMSPVLILDDLGRGMINPWRNERIIEILDHRWKHMKPTFFTSNLESVTAFTEWLGDKATTDRLLMPEGNESGRVQVFLMTGKSWR
jgi:DNA replication protein DnaC